MAHAALLVAATTIYFVVIRRNHDCEEARFHLFAGGSPAGAAVVDSDWQVLMGDLSSGLCDSFWKDASDTCDVLRAHADTVPAGNEHSPRERTQRLCDMWANFAKDECARLATQVAPK